MKIAATVSVMIRRHMNAAIKEMGIFVQKVNSAAETPVVIRIRLYARYVMGQEAALSNAMTAIIRLFMERLKAKRNQ